MVKFILYILVIPLVIWSFDAVNLNGIFKKIGICKVDFSI